MMKVGFRMNKPKVEDHIKTEYIDVTITHKLKKDMQLNEEICKDCNGLGIKIYHNHYGLTIDGQKLGNSYFPFDKESLYWCPSCYNGVRKRCEFCNEFVPKGRIYCSCDKSLTSRGQAQWQKKLDIWNRADKISYTEALNKFEMVYVDSWNEYIMKDDLEKQFEYWVDLNWDSEDIEGLKEILLNLKIYGTNKTHAIFDADSILENAMENLHEDAYVSPSIKNELQELLDGISEKIKNSTTTYNVDYSIGIQLTENDIENWNYIKAV